MKVLLGISLIVFLILCVVFGPLLSIWALNTLFKLGIEYTFWTWLAMIFVNLTLCARIVK